MHSHAFRWRPPSSSLSRLPQTSHKSRLSRLDIGQHCKVSKWEQNKVFLCLPSPSEFCLPFPPNCTFSDFAQNCSQHPWPLLVFAYHSGSLIRNFKTTEKSKHISSYTAHWTTPNAFPIDACLAYPSLLVHPACQGLKRIFSAWIFFLYLCPLSPTPCTLAHQPLLCWFSFKKSVPP